MNINFTLIIQVCNFFIAYILLRRFFFRPVIGIITEEEIAKSTIYTAIEEQRQFLQSQREIGQKQWNDCRTYFMNRRPDSVLGYYGIFKNISPYISSHILSDIEIERYSVEIKKVLEEKIRHVW